MLQYSLTKKTVGKDPTEYVAYINQKRKTDLEMILDYMVAEGTGLTRPQALAYYEKLSQAIEYFVETMGGVSTPMFNVRLTITGVWNHIPICLSIEIIQSLYMRR